MTNFITEIERESAALIDLAVDLEQQQAVSSGKIVSSYISPKMAERMIRVTTQEIAGGISLREKALQAYEQDERRRQEREAAAQRVAATMAFIAKSLPAEWGAVVNGSSIQTAIGVRLELRDRLDRSSWRSRVVGEKIELHCNFETRHFPRKKDGSFSIAKIVAAGNELSRYALARRTREEQEAQDLAAFQSIVQPFVQYVTFGKSHSWTPSQNFHLKAEALGDGKYAVRRTVTEFVDAEQLAAILGQEVGLVERDVKVQA